MRFISESIFELQEELEDDGHEESTDSIDAKSLIQTENSNSSLSIEVSESIPSFMSTSPRAPTDHFALKSLPLILLQSVQSRDQESQTPALSAIWKNETAEEHFPSINSPLPAFFRDRFPMLTTASFICNDSTTASRKIKTAPSAQAVPTIPKASPLSFTPLSKTITSESNQLIDLDTSIRFVTYVFHRKVN
jgi:hypothetical protein